MRVKDCQLWDGKEEVFVRGLRRPVLYMGKVILPAHVKAEDDRRIKIATTSRGQIRLVYLDGGGFKAIQLEDGK